MSTLHERINNYLLDQNPDSRVVEVAESDSTEYEYMLRRAEINQQNDQRPQVRPKRGPADG
jgi:hypothetical protein